VAKVLRTIIVNCRLHLSVWGSLIAKDSHLCFCCLYSYLLTDHAIAIQKGKDSTAYSTTKNKKQK